MTKITYTVRVATIDAARIDSVEDLTVVPSEFTPLVITPQSEIARSMDGLTIQRTTTGLWRSVTFAQAVIDETSIRLWEEFYESQMASSDTFELDARALIGVRRVLTCMLQSQPFAPARVSCRDYSSALTADVIAMGAYVPEHP